MKKKIFLSVICVLMVLIITTGCNNNEKNKVNVNVLDSKVNYILIKGKKIYLTRNFKDFTLQFKGLNCLVNGEYQDQKEIDSIDENDATLTQSARTNYITCYNTDERKYTEEINISMHTYTEDQGDINEIYWWRFSSTKGLFDLQINNKTLSFGTHDRIPSKKDNMLDVMGSNYETEAGHFDTTYYSYFENEIEYEFGVDDENSQLESFSLSISK